MSEDDEHFAAFAKDLQALFEKHFEKGTMVAVAFAPPSDGEVRYVMNVQKPAGIAIFEAAADLARKEMGMPYKVVNPEKIEGFAQDILDQNPRLRVEKKQVVDMIYKELESTLNIEKALKNVRAHLSVVSP